MIGNLQTNKVKYAVKFLITFILLIPKSRKKFLKNKKIKKLKFIQVNIGNENQNQE